MFRLQNLFSVVSRQYSSQTSSYRPTIYALSTQLARSAIGVVRISGSQSSYIYKKLANTKKDPLPRISSLRKLKSPRTGVLLDESLTLFFRAPNLYTGEDLLELHLHGGVAIIKSVLNEIKLLHDPKNGILIRYAENGEFSQRAFLNGRFDLTELEGVREMIDAETETQRVSALSSMTGRNKQTLMGWREQIVKNIALLTTVIDFGEDHDVEEVAHLFEDVDKNIQALKAEINLFLQKTERSEILLKGIKVTLLGPPNAGKSSLLNVLANKDAAIVSNIAGTTRDAIDIPLDINGYKVVIGDTAGIRNIELADAIETEGIRRARERGLQSDIVLVILPFGSEFTEVDDEFFAQIRDLNDSGKRIVGILNKEDLSTSNETIEEAANKFSTLTLIPQNNIHAVSCKTNIGVPSLMRELEVQFKDITETGSSDPISISERAKDLLINDVLYGFDQFSMFKDDDDIVLATEGLRQSVEGIGKITGEAIGVEEILGVVFSSFCIGK